MIGVFHRPLAPRQAAQPGAARLGVGQAGHKIARVLGRLAVLLESGGVAGVEDLPGAGKGQRIGFDVGHAHGAGFNAAAIEFGLGKRGVRLASFCSALARTVG